ncbi:hypothetical protein AB0M28_25710 [Streptomyces sp. NPDC051940]|uniref:hypothetical protein n=1 Tax=Streptomyces sp. NPDC051940 TaxID=3155675 RepID=UPI00343426C5
MIGSFYGRLPGGPVVKLLSTTLVLAVLVTGGWFGFGLVFPERDPSCAEGVEERGPAEECTGVTDGSYVFAPNLGDISARIKAENDFVDKQTGGGKKVSAISLAVVLPMAPAQQPERDKTLSQLRGVFLAQYQANHGSNEKQPLIRLLLANPGRGHEHWRPVADQLGEMTRSEERLRAVVGFDVSTRITQQAIQYLTANLHIPVVGGPITADDFGNSAQQPRRYPGLARVVPTTSGEAAAMAHLHAGVKPEDTLIIEDIREGDNYVKSLRDAFQSLSQGSKRASEQYRAPDDYHEEGNTAVQFQQMVTSVCTSTARYLYFAGRPVQLRQFINELGRRGCREKTYTVISGSGASTLVNDAKLDWTALEGENPITVEYAAIAHPDAWSGAGAPRTGGSVAAYREFEQLARSVLKLKRDDLIDSRAITMYDAGLTAVTSVRGTQAGVPSTQQVADGWLRLHGQYGKVNGASGWICLDNYGNAYNKAVAVVRLDEKAPGRVRFVQVAWPEGKATDKDCTAPR